MRVFNLCSRAQIRQNFDNSFVDVNWNASDVDDFVRARTGFQQIHTLKLRRISLITCAELVAGRTNLERKTNIKKQSVLKTER